jgi:hypothetical protein
VVHKGLLLAVTMAVLRDPGCGTETTSGGVNAPCTRDKDCSPGLTCTGGVCLGPEAGPPPPSDAGADAGPEDAPHD